MDAVKNKVDVAINGLKDLILSDPKGWAEIATSYGAPVGESPLDAAACLVNLYATVPEARIRIESWFKASPLYIPEYHEPTDLHADSKFDWMNPVGSAVGAVLGGLFGNDAPAAPPPNPNAGIEAMMARQLAQATQQQTLQDIRDQAEEARERRERKAQEEMEAAQARRDKIAAAAAEEASDAKTKKYLIWGGSILGGIVLLGVGLWALFK